MSLNAWGDPQVALAASYALSLRPEDLPEAPWPLKVSKSQQIGSGFFRGGPFYQVTDNRKWLAELQRELNAGPDQARARCGGLQQDLFALCQVMNGYGPVVL